MESHEFLEFFLPEWPLRVARRGPIIAVAQAACNRQDGRSLIEFHDSVGVPESLWLGINPPSFLRDQVSDGLGLV